MRLNPIKNAINIYTQLTSHLKSCHTKVEDIEIGNAIAVNSM